LLAKYVAVVEYRPIMSVNIVSQFQYSTFGHNWPTMQHGLSAIAELLVFTALNMQRTAELLTIWHVFGVQFQGVRALSPEGSQRCVERTSLNLARICAIVAS